MQKEEKDSPITDNKKLLKRILDRFDGAALLTLRKSSPEELDLLCDFITQHRLGARSVVPATRPQQQQQQSETKKGKSERTTVSNGNKKKSDEGASS